MAVTVRVHVREAAVHGLGPVDPAALRDAVAEALDGLAADGGLVRAAAVGGLRVTVRAGGRPAEAVVADAVRSALGSVAER